jgi:hypothetical protein
VSGGALLTGRPSKGGDALGAAAGVGALERAATGAAALDALASVEALLPDSFESAVQDNIASIASRQTAENTMRSKLARCVVMVWRRSCINVAQAGSLAHRLIPIHG